MNLVDPKGNLTSERGRGTIPLPQPKKGEGGVVSRKVSALKRNNKKELPVVEI